MEKNIRNISNVAILVPDTREVLLQKKGTDYDTVPVSEGKWFLIGGGIESEETPRETALREVQEELGIIPHNLHYSHTFKYNVPHKFHGEKHIFVHYTSRDMSKYVIGEGVGIALFAMEELESVHIYNYDSIGLHDILRKLEWMV